MKKLMIAAFAVMAAVAANAAASSWIISCKGIVGKDGTGTYTSGSTSALVIYATLTGSSDWFALDDASATISVASGKIAATTFTTNLIGNEEYNSYDFKFVITDGDKVFTSTIVQNKAVQKSSSTTLGFGNQSGQTWESVPEPTSGLLLLLGVAGLALKRKRA